MNRDSWQQLVEEEMARRATARLQWIKTKGRKPKVKKPCKAAPTKEEVLNRIRSKSVSAKHGCIEWTKGLNAYGYGIFRFGKEQLIHRVIWRIFMGDIPENYCVLHRCDNRKCLNIEHLFIGTKADNSADCVSKNRQDKKLNPDDVRWIRDYAENRKILYPSGKLRIPFRTIPYLCDRFGLTYRSIQKIIRRERWKHIT